MDFSIEKLQQILKNNLSEKRYIHSILAMKDAEYYTLKYKPDDSLFMERVKKATLMHDIAKEMSKEQIIKYINDNNINLDITDEKNIPLVHGIIGADICKKRFHFDQEMCTAIKYHTTGSIKMTLMDKIVFIADKTGRENRDNFIENIKSEALNDLDKSICMYIENKIRKLKIKKIPINNLSIKVLNILKKHNFG